VASPRAGKEDARSFVDGTAGSSIGVDSCWKTDRVNKQLVVSTLDRPHQMDLIII